MISDADVLRETSFLGNPVVITRGSWRRILQEHRELRGREDDVIAVINEARPEHRLIDSDYPARIHFYAPDRTGRTTWHRAIVDFDLEPALVVNSHLARRMKRGLKRFEP